LWAAALVTIQDATADVRLDVDGANARQWRSASSAAAMPSR